MKKTFLFLIVAFSVLYSADAQYAPWYSPWNERCCNVANLNNFTAEDFDCLWAKAKKTVRSGVITTGIGVVSFVSGYLWRRFGDGGPAGLDLGSGALMLAGPIIVCIGIPTWVTGGKRLSLLRSSPHYSQPLNLRQSASLTISKNQLNNSYSFGLTATLAF